MPQNVAFELLKSKIRALVTVGENKMCSKCQNPWQKSETWKELNINVVVNVIISKCLLYLTDHLQGSNGVECVPWFFIYI